MAEDAPARAGICDMVLGLCNVFLKKYCAAIYWHADKPCKTSGLPGSLNFKDDTRVACLTVVNCFIALF